MRFPVLFSALLLSTILHAQDSLITMSSLPAVVWVGQVYQVTWTVQGRTTAESELFPAPGFTVLAGPQRSSSYTNRNDTVQEEEAVTYRLQVTDTGDLDLPRMRVHLRQGIAVSEPRSIRALPEGAPSPKPDARSQALLFGVAPKGQLAGYAYQGGGYVTLRTEQGEEVKRLLTEAEARALEAYLRKLAEKK